MTLDEFRREMISYRQAVDDEAKSFKDPHIALERLCALYRKFDASERQMADRVLCEWTVSENKGLRFDARWIADELKIVAVLPALQELATRLASRTSAGTADELETVTKIIEDLKK
jgi:hypothetical protein